MQLFFACSKFMPVPLITKVLSPNGKKLTYKAWPELAYVFEKH